ncbi:MAG: DUF4175 family protein, partial [Elusimicrobia bacterium]|nr:DUF4175 family protein [Candidatus Obscuribacterium magneticum]
AVPSEFHFRSDDLKIAGEFMKAPPAEDVSSSFRHEFLARIAKGLRSISPVFCFPSWHWKRALYLSTIPLFLSGTLWAFFPNYFPFNPQLLFPFGSNDFEDMIYVVPGNGEVEWGGTVEIKVAMKGKTIFKPALYTKTEKDWMMVSPVRDESKIQVYEFKNIVEPLVYRVRWKNDWGRKYQIQPYKSIQLEKMVVTIRQPDYVGGQANTQDSPVLKGLRGSLVKVDVESNVNMKTVLAFFSDGSEKESDFISGTRFVLSFPISNTGAYGFFITSQEGKVFRTNPLYPILALDDQPPRVSLLSPEKDLIVGEREKLPLTFMAQDDFGVKEIRLVWSKQAGGKNEELIKNLNPASESILDTFVWDMAQEKFQPGDVIHFKIKASDGNVVAGPGFAETVERTLEISSFEKGHEKVEESLETWRDEVMELLAEMNMVKSEVQSPESDLGKLSPQFNQSLAEGQKLEKDLEKIVSRMEEDPLADYSVWAEHKALSENFSALNQGAFKGAQASFQTGNREALSSQLDQITSELERMSALSESMSKKQRVRDILDSGENLSDIGEDLLKNLDAASQTPGGISPKEMAEINELLEQAQKMLSDMARSIQKFPGELPEDFVNQQALKNIPMGESQDLLSRLAEAIQRGDFKSAKDLAKKFLDMAQKMKSSLSDAHESFLQENSYEDLKEKIMEEGKKLNEITEKQKQVLAETQKLESKRLASVLKAQDDLLAALAKRQENVIESTRKYSEQQKLGPFIRQIFGAQLRPMTDVLTEFKAKRLQNSRNNLQAIIAQLSVAELDLKKSTAPAVFVSGAGGLRQEEEDILKMLSTPVQPQTSFDGEDLKKFSSLQMEQSQLAEETKGVQTSLQKLARKTANLSLDLLDSLGKARSDMGEASKELGQNQSQPAQTFEESALRHLSDSQSKLGESLDSMGEMASDQMGQMKPGGMSGPKVIIRGGTRGATGTQTGKVKIPTAEDYKPPKEFREDLLDALKEKYPEIYKETIQKYFKRLAD